MKFTVDKDFKLVQEAISKDKELVDSQQKKKMVLVGKDKGLSYGEKGCRAWNKERKNRFLIER